jgi:SAM-dependent methyltransferase
MLYDHPQYYEVAFSFRDIEAETDFMTTCLKRFSQIPVRRILEIGCGHAPHAGALTERGFGYVGLDINRSMIDYAESKWALLRPPPQFVIGDMVDFECPEPVDFTFVMLGSLYLQSAEEMASHFDCVSRALQPGGLYFLDWCVQFSDPMVPRNSSEVVRQQDGIKIGSRFDIRLVDPARQLYEETWTVHVDDHGQQRQIRTVELNRAIYPQEFLLFVENHTRFEFVGWWHDWDLDRPIEKPGEPTRPLVLLRRK